jgi:hypothetical protein
MKQPGAGFAVHVLEQALPDPRGCGPVRFYQHGHGKQAALRPAFGLNGVGCCPAS